MTGKIKFFINPSYSIVSIIAVAIVLSFFSFTQDSWAANPPDKPQVTTDKVDGEKASPMNAMSETEFNLAMQSYLTKDENVEKIGTALQRFFEKKQKEQMAVQAKQQEEKVESQFNNPVKVDIGNSPVQGNPNAKVTIIEFSDYQCPFCKRGYEVMAEVLKAYPNDVKLVFKNLPLEIHPEAKPAALAALAAGEQGKFWEMYKELFENQQSLGQATYISLAQKLALDVPKFEADMKSEKLKKTLEEDAKIGEQLGVRGTPGFFVNGVQVSGAQPFSVFKNLVDRWLAKSK